MSNPTDIIQCPSCGESIDVSSALTDRLRKENEIELAASRKALMDAEKVLNARELALEEAIEKGLAERIEIVRAALKEAVTKEKGEQIAELEKELEEKSSKVVEFNKLKASHGSLQRKMEEMEGEYEVKAQEKIASETKRVRAEAQQKAAAESELELRKKEKIIEDLKSDLKAANVRAEQGSMQLQGEVQELAIEEWLQSSFPLDTIEEVKKGAMGGDCIQHVNTRERLHCGMIYYESKRTKSFQPSWLAKFKEDMRQKGADIGVLVTEAMPAEMEAMGQKVGIWICTFNEFKSLAVILRAMVIKLSMVVESSKNRGEKMGMLYDYMTGPEFKLTIESIVEGIGAMHSDLESERRSMRRIWKKREKQIERVILSTTDMYGAIQGIAGLKALPSIKALELPAVSSDREVPKK